MPNFEKTPDATVIYVSPSDVKPDPLNPRTHSLKQIAKLARSIDQTKYFNPVLIDENNVLIAGHGRLLAAQRLKLDRIPAFRICHLTEARKRALLIADNKIASESGWNKERLAIILPDLSVKLEAEGVDVTLTGFETAEVDQILIDFDDKDTSTEDHVPAVASLSVSRSGDLWILGPHRLLCGNARSKADVRTLMGSEKAAMLFSDPPYNISIAKIVGRGRTKHREFLEASGEQSTAEFVSFLSETLGNGALFLNPGALAYVCMDWRHAAQLVEAAKAIFDVHINTAIWVKTNAGQGSFYRSQHEQVLIFRNGRDQHQNNIELGRHGRNRSNVWTYPGANTFRAGRMDDLRDHPTVKPTALVADAIQDCTRRRDIVLDLFCGSGTTILAAEKVGRRCFAIEIDPLYVDLAVRRWQTLTGEDAILDGTVSTFSEVATNREAA